MELHNYYSLDEAIDRKAVLKRLKQLQKELKIIMNNIKKN